MRHIDTALIHLICHHIAHVTIWLSFAIVQHDLLITFVRIFHRVTETFGTSSTPRHRWILLLRNAAGRLFIDLYLVQINGQLTIALIIHITPVIINTTRLASIVVVVTIAIIINELLRKIFGREHCRFGTTELVLQM